MITIDKIKSDLKKKNSGSLLDNAPNYLDGCVIQKRKMKFVTFTHTFQLCKWWGDLPMWFVLHVMDYKQITTPCCNCQLLSLRKMNDWKIQKQIQKRRRKKSSRKNIGKICSIFEKYCHFSSKMCKQHYRTFTFTIRAQSFTYYFIEVRSLSRHKQRFYIQQMAQGIVTLN